MTTVVQISSYGDASQPLAGLAGDAKPGTSKGALARYMLDEARLMDIMVKARLAQREALKEAGWRRLDKVAGTVLANIREELPGKRAHRLRNLQNFNASGMGSRNHVGGARPAGERNNEIGLALGEHLTVTDGASGPAVLPPVSPECSAGDAVEGRPLRR